MTNPVTLSGTGAIAVTLASVTANSSGLPSSPVMAVKIGTPAGSGCTGVTSASATPGFSAQVNAASLAAGTYCIAVNDASGLSEPSAVTVRVVVTVGTPASNPTTTATTATFQSMVGPQGFAVHQFNLATSGTLTLSMTSAGDGTPVIGLAAGVWDGLACRLTTSLQTAASADPQITAAVDAGSYCLRVADLGTLINQIGFSITIGES